MNANNHKKSEIFRANQLLSIVIAVLIALIIAISVIIGVGFGVYGPDASKWFQKDDCIVSSVENSPALSIHFGVKRKGIADLPIAQIDTQTVYATLDSRHGAQTVTATLSWLDPTSDWATGKSVSDYVTMTEDEEATQGVWSATLTKVEAFGEPIILTVVSDENSDARATAQLDCIKRIESITFSTTNVKIGGMFDYDATNAVPQYTVNYGVGTVQGTLSLDSVSFDLTTFIQLLGNTLDDDCITFATVARDITCEVKNGQFNFNRSDIFTFADGTDADTIQLYETKFVNFLSEYRMRNGVIGMMYLNFTYTSPDGQKLRFAQTQPSASATITASDYTYTPLVTEVNLNGDQFYLF